MFGTDYDTRDGTCVRDYINVEELADAHVLALEYLFNNGTTNFFNLGTNDGNTVREIFKTCEDVTHKSIPVDMKPRRPGDPSSLIANNSKAKKILSWKPEKTIQDTINTAYVWEKRLLNLNKTE